MFDRRLITHFNWPLLLVTLLLTGAGLVNLHSATSNFDTGAHSIYVKAQAIWILIGFVVMLGVTLFHYRFYYQLSYLVYFFSILLLILVLIIGKTVSEHQSWIVVGPFRFQPTEVAKLGFIMAMARYMTNWDARFKVGIREILPSLFIYLIPTALIIVQGDLGSSLFIGLIYVTFLLVQGVKTRLIVGLTVIGVATVLLAYFFVLSPYQKNRVQNFLNPEMDPKGSGYQLIQAKIAVGSGGLTGKGYLKGQTHKLQFVPERHTDFIFPVLAEEWGFLGCFTVLLLFLLFLFLIVQVAYKTTERYLFFVCIGVATLFFWHLVINLGGVLGLMPLTGVPLPFFSYGGSALLTQWIGSGLVFGISLRRFVFT